MCGRGLGGLEGVGQPFLDDAIGRVRPSLSASRRSVNTKVLPMPSELARTLLVLGLLQRRAGKRRSAQSSPDAARDAQIGKHPMRPC